MRHKIVLALLVLVLGAGCAAGSPSSDSGISTATLPAPITTDIPTDIPLPTDTPAPVPTPDSSCITQTQIDDVDTWATSPTDVRKFPESAWRGGTYPSIFLNRDASGSVFLYVIDVSLEIQFPAGSDYLDAGVYGDITEVRCAATWLSYHLNAPLFTYVWGEFSEGDGAVKVRAKPAQVNAPIGFTSSYEPGENGYDLVMYVFVTGKVQYVILDEEPLELENYGVSDFETFYITLGEDISQGYAYLVSNRMSVHVKDGPPTRMFFAGEGVEVPYLYDWAFSWSDTGLILGGTPTPTFTPTAMVVPTLNIPTRTPTATVTPTRTPSATPTP